MSEHDLVDLEEAVRAELAALAGVVTPRAGAAAAAVAAAVEVGARRRRTERNRLRLLAAAVTVVAAGAGGVALSRSPAGLAAPSSEASPSSSATTSTAPIAPCTPAPDCRKPIDGLHVTSVVSPFNLLEGKIHMDPPRPGDTTRVTAADAVARARTARWASTSGVLPTRIEFGRLTDFDRKTGNKLDFNERKVVLVRWIGVPNYDLPSGPGPQIPPMATPQPRVIPPRITIYVVLDPDTGADLGSMNDPSAA